MTVDEFIKKWTAENPLEKAAKGTSDGALCGEFLIGENKKIRFSKGNLQFNASKGTHKTADDKLLQGTWQFAEHQWDVIGKGNEKISQSYNGFIDLFGWGTSGWASGAKAYQPWSTSTSYDDYYPGGDRNNSLINAYTKADWGQYNAISNGGDKPGRWRTLTTQEWRYLFQHNKWTVGKIEGKMCFLFIPEKVSGLVELSCEKSESCSFTESEYGKNKFTAEEFKKYEDQGVVALPCGGYRNGTSLNYVGSYGYYWSSSACNGNYAYDFCFRSGGVNSSDSSYRDYGFSVRLVQDLK